MAGPSTLRTISASSANSRLQYRINDNLPSEPTACIMAHQESKSDKGLCQNGKFWRSPLDVLELMKCKALIITQQLAIITHRLYSIYISFREIDRC